MLEVTGLKQFQFEYQNLEQLKNELIKIKQWQSSHIFSSTLFQVYSTILDNDIFIEMFKEIEDILPNAYYLGCSSNGNIIDGKMSGSEVIVICTIFEYPSTKIKVIQHDMDNPTYVAEKLVEEINHNSWVKAVEFLVTIRGKSMTNFCNTMSNVRQGVKMFGGGALSADLNSDIACVYSNSMGYSAHGIVAILLGGDDFYVDDMFITGWKPLGRIFKITSADGYTLKEIDNKPAYEAYYKYLNIENDENFFFNTLEFPFLYKHNGIDLLRAPVLSNPDGSLTMTSDMEEGSNARIAYGDPWTILDSVNNRITDVEKFCPEVIHIFSCAGRRTFWGNEEVSNETIPFQAIAPTSGFFTSCEFLRTNKYVNQHNVTLVIAMMREGEKIQPKETLFLQKEKFSTKVSMIQRLATFIEAATEELEEANRKLALSVVTDGMTNLLNRTEINRLITKATKDKPTTHKNLCLVMLDLDNFKSVNDTYGHQEGDKVIIALSNILKNVSNKYENTHSGRWGGEEFMLLLEGYTLNQATDMAESIRVKFAETKFKKFSNRTVSIGVTEIKENELPDTACIRVDNALYKAKKSGKNTIVVF